MYLKWCDWCPVDASHYVGLCDRSGRLAFISDSRRRSWDRLKGTHASRSMEAGSI
jgi:hypothetical protein